LLDDWADRIPERLMSAPKHPPRPDFSSNPENSPKSTPLITR
jgi:hypothetical protein